MEINRYIYITLFLLQMGIFPYLLDYLVKQIHLNVVLLKVLAKFHVCAASGLPLQFLLWYEAMLFILNCIELHCTKVN